MKQILGLGIGAVAFTPGGAGFGTLVFSGLVGFHPTRLLAVTNVTQKKLIYAAEISGKAGAWTAVTTSGGTLTLEYSTTGHNAADALRCLYDADAAPAVEPRVGGNLWPIPLDACALTGTRTADYGPGQRAGSRSTRLVLSGDNAGANTGDMTVAGRSDGAMFGLAVWLRGTGSVELRISGTGAVSAASETTASLVVAVTSTWTRYVVRGYAQQHDLATVRAEIRPSGAGATVEACDVDFRLLDDATSWPAYEAPNGVAVPIFICKRLSTSFALWGDSMIEGSQGVLWPPKLALLLGGSPVYNGGIAGETSTEIKDRFVVTSTANKIYRAYGITVFWCGTNNSDEYDTVIADIDAMATLLRHGRFLVVSIVPTDNTPIGGAWYRHHNELNRRLRNRYGRRFVDVFAVARCGTAYMSPLYQKDTAHFNEAGCGLVAHMILQAAARLGYLDGCGLRISGEDDQREETQRHQVAYNSVVTGDDESVLLLDAGIRSGFTIWNNSTATLYVAFGYSATSGGSIAAIASQGRQTFTGYSGPVSGIWSAVNGDARVTEII